MVGVGLALAIGGVLLGLYAIPPMSPIAFLVLATAAVITYGGIQLMRDSRRA